MNGGARVIELGSGVGVVGTYLSAVGSQVLLTDLPTLVGDAIDHNLKLNEDIRTIDDDDDEYDRAGPPWLATEGDAIRRIGRGWAAATPLDWTLPLQEQLTPLQASSIEFIVASDVIFLASMLNALLDTVDSLLKASSSSSSSSSSSLSSNNNPSFLLSFQRRDANDGEESAAFTTVSGFIAEIHRRGWTLDCLAWRPLTVWKESSNDGTVTEDESEVFVFEIKP